MSQIRQKYIFMNQSSKKYSLADIFLQRTARFSLALAVGFLPLIDASAGVAEQLQAQPQTTKPDPNRAATAAKIRQLLEQGQKLLEQGTAESRLGAIALYEQALKIARETGDRTSVATTLLSIGTVYIIQNDNQKALEYFNQGLPIRRELKDSFGEAVLLVSIGRAYTNLGENQKAINFLSQALSLFKAGNQPQFTASTLISIGQVYSNLGKTKLAIDSYNSALAIQRSQKDTAAQADTLKILGTRYLLLGDSQKALASLQAALELQRAIGNLSGQADILSQLGTLYSSLGENQKALASFNSALSLQRSAQGKLSGSALAFNRSSQALTLIGIASTYKTSGDIPKALDSYNTALSLVRAAGNSYAEAEVLNQISLVYDFLGDKQKALESLQSALGIFRNIKNRPREAFTLNTLAGIYSSMGEPQKALDAYNQALELQKSVGDRPGVAGTLYYIADVYSDLGNYKLSVNTYNSALEVARSVGDRTREAQILDSIGTVYRLAKDYQQALNYYNQALAKWRDSGDRFQAVATLTGIVRAYESLKDYPKALDAANNILSEAQAQKNPFFSASALALMGRVYLASGDNQKALDVLTQAASGFREQKVPLAQANALGNVGKAYDKLGKAEQAIVTYNQELALRQTLGDRTGIAETIYNIAVVERKRGNLNAARNQIEAVIKQVESLRSQVVSQELRTSYFASVQNYYKFYVDLLMQLHKQQPNKGYNTLALQAAERARARSLIDLLTEANADIRQGVAPQLLEKERNLQQRLDANDKRRAQLLNGKYTPNQLAGLEKDTNALLTQYQQIQTQIRQNSPRYASLTQPQPLTLAQMQKLLDPNTVLLEYFLGEERSYLWMVTPNGISSYELPKQEQIETAARRYYQLLTDKRLDLVESDLAEVSDQLSQILLLPVASQLAEKRLVIVSNGALQYIPFAALKDPVVKNDSNQPQPLIVKHEVVNLPSVSTLAVTRSESKRKLPPKTLAVFADPVFDVSDERVKKRPDAKPPLVTAVLNWVKYNNSSG